MYILPLTGTPICASFAVALLAVFDESVTLWKLAPVDPVNPVELLVVAVPIVP